MVVFYRRYRDRILLLTPLVCGALLFVLSFFAALRTMSSAVFPKDFNNVKVKVRNYAVKEIDQKTHILKWSLTARSAESNTEQTKANVRDPFIEVFDDKGSKVEFSITANNAYLDKDNSEVNLFNNVDLVTLGKGYELSAEQLKFKKDSENIEVDSLWKLKTKQGYEIGGIAGKISKDFKLIVSTGKAFLEKSNEDFNLYAHEIKLTDSDSENLVIVATGDATLKFKSQGSIKANKLFFYKDGTIIAKGSVKVVTDNASCYSNDLHIKPNPDKSPKIAVFEGNPRVEQNNGMIYADSVIYDFLVKQVRVEGNIHS